MRLEIGRFHSNYRATRCNFATMPREELEDEKYCIEMWLQVR